MAIETTDNVHADTNILGSWTPLEWLLRARPEEFPPQDPTRGHLASWARRFLGHPALTAEEKARIRAVWLDGQHRPAAMVTTGRWEELQRIAGVGRPRRRPTEEGA